MREVDFSEATLARRWHEIKPHLREDLIPWTRNLLKHLLETCVEEELEVYLRAARHKRTVDRHDYRNGAYARDLTTELGLLLALRVFRGRTAGFQPPVFPPLPAATARRHPVPAGGLHPRGEQRRWGRSPPSSWRRPSARAPSPD